MSEPRAIPFLTVHLPDPSLVAADYTQIFASGMFTNSGPVERRFAGELARWIGGGVAVSVTSNATSAIQLACRALFPEDRRYVLVASFTAVAGPLAVRWSGHEPLFIDIESDSWQPDAEAAQNLLEREGDTVAGILLTNTFGTANRDVDRWERLARNHGLALVIDSAPGFASRYPWDETLGARGDCEIFSFHATKTVAIGEGGAVAARDPAIANRIDQLKNFGYNDERRSFGNGLNAKLPELSSAIGLRQLEALPRRIARRSEVLRLYLEGLEPLGCAFQSGVTSSVPPFVSTLLASRGERDAVGAELARQNIGSREYFNPPVHRHPAFVGCRVAGQLKVTDDIADRVISLPLDDDLVPADVDRIIDVVKDVIGD